MPNFEHPRLVRKREPMPTQLLQGDSAIELKNFPDNHFDAVVADPPYGWNFMGQAFDTFQNREHFISEMEKVFKETLRTLKPGAHGLFFAAAWRFSA